MSRARKAKAPALAEAPAAPAEATPKAKPTPWGVLGLPTWAPADERGHVSVAALLASIFDSSSDPVVGLIDSVDRDLGMLMQVIRYEQSEACEVTSGEDLLMTILRLKSSLDVARELHVRQVRALIEHTDAGEVKP